jgi:peptidoglycan/LPS O-acetylase OafA/YrhL
MAKAKKVTDRGRFDLLDGLRGVAALAVMVHHYTLHNGLHWLKNAWVAVDLFFILSGFVIAFAYGGKILKGLSFPKFMMARLLRLGPLYYCGLFLGIAAAAIVLTHYQPTQVGEPNLMAASVWGFFWLPHYNWAVWPAGNSHAFGAVYPLNDPAWSLFFELFVNVLFWFYVRTFKTFSSGTIVILSVAIYVGCTLYSGAMDPGFDVLNFFYGFPRVIAEFFLGALIYQKKWHQKPRHVLLAVGVGAAAIGTFSSLEGDTLAFLSSLTIVPWAVALWSAVPIRGALARVCSEMGKLSYPIYILQFPVFRLLYEVTPVGSWGLVEQTLAASAAVIGVGWTLGSLDLMLQKKLRPASSSVVSQPRPMKGRG